MDTESPHPNFSNTDLTSNGGNSHHSSWTFLTNHAHVLICLSKDPGARLRDVATWVGITERAVQKIVADLEAAGILTRTREGRRNHYEINGQSKLRHPVESHRSVNDLIYLVLEGGEHKAGE